METGRIIEVISIFFIFCHYIPKLVVRVYLKRVLFISCFPRRWADWLFFFLLRCDLRIQRIARN